METFVLCFQRNFKTIGKVVYGINNGINSNNGYISNIKVDKLYRNKGIGTKLLKLSENHLKDSYNISTIKGVSWSYIYDNGDVNIFLEKNGYIKTNKDITIYEDYSDIYEITALEKKV